MKFGHVGYEGIPEADEAPSTSSSLNFWVESGKTRRILMLEDAPFGAHMHPLYFWNHSFENVVCLKKEGLGDCPICNSGEVKEYPRFIGHYSIIDMGEVIVNDETGDIDLLGYTSDKGVTYQFQRKIIPAKLGTKNKEGVLKKFQRMNLKKQGLKWTVWDVYRGGTKEASIGSEFEFIMKLDTADAVESYLRSWGCDVDIPEFSILPFNFMELLAPWSEEQLQNIVNSKLGSGRTAKTASNSRRVNSRTKVHIDSEDKF